MRWLIEFKRRSCAFRPQVCVVQWYVEATGYVDHAGLWRPHCDVRRFLGEIGRFSREDSHSRTDSML